jgi:hypothetical protein
VQSLFQSFMRSMNHAANNPYSYCADSLIYG